MDRQELIKKYIEFFQSKDHKEIKNSSLIPENDPTVLFTTAGMHPLVPYLLGETHPSGKRLCNVQRCIRTGDIEEVGDTTHHTFFEMLGNWSVGDYFKKEAIEYSFEFLTKILNIPIERLAVTCFAGDENAPKDEEAASTWKSIGITKIGFLGKEDNWWGPAGKTGPCGPDTEMFYWKSNNKKAEEFDPNNEGWVEIWNDVLMQYIKDEKGSYNEAKQKNIDTGMGVERTVSILNNLEDNYLADMWLPIIKEIEKLSGKKYNTDEGTTRSMRIIADHLKAAAMIISDGITPSNTEQGYVLRKLIRRAVRYGKDLGLTNFTKEVSFKVFEIYNDYEHLIENKEKILDAISKEEERFEKVLEEGLKVSEKLFSEKTPIAKDKFIKFMQLPSHQETLKTLWDKKEAREDYSIWEANISKEEIDKATITGEEGFLLFQSHGLPAEIILELAREKNLLFYRGEFKKELQKHQKLSRTATEGKFKSGLADDSKQTKKLHTATHILNEALKKILGSREIQQKGSNITGDRLRFDFNFDRKLTPEELNKIEDLVNEKIDQSLPIRIEEMSLEEAKKLGAEGVFGHKYGETVRVYFVGESGKEFSKELCAGPHVSNTKELGHFKIKKEESSSAGVRRIKAILE
jgi:alanyl-tRNA synthetase